MTALKNKLAEKIEVINSETILNLVPTQIGTSNAVLEQENNVIRLKNADDNSICSIVPSFAITLNEAKERLLMLQNFVKEIMIPGIDYGLIPQCQKPTLFKSGAEKLCDIFGFSKQFEVTSRLEDWEKPLFHYEIKAILINKKTGLIEAEGLGCCNNRERKFKTQDGFSIINTILKMAKKRALIDAVLSATRSSGIFTQDIENTDITYQQNTGNLSTVSTQSTNSNNNYTEKSQVFINNAPNKNLKKPQIDKNQQTMLISIINQRKFQIEDVRSIMKEKYQVNESKYLNSEQAEDFIEFLKLYNTI